MIEFHETNIPLWDVSLGRMEWQPQTASRLGCILDRMQGGGVIIFSTERGIPMECRYPNIRTILFDFAA